MKFSFIHAADLHLDSPLRGLASKSPEQAKRVGDASRQAFDNLIALAIEEECRFVLIAGDAFDGQWRDYTTGLFFASRMRQLRDAGIDVYMILGNHDAENDLIGRLELTNNVHVLSSRKPESIVIDQLGVAIHGRSFPQRDVTDNLAAGYPEPCAGLFNIGLLHTACTGRNGHAAYAPCTVEQLSNHGYDYWALGHVHTREVLQTDPYIVFPGNLQGRHIGETGSKGATLVQVEDGHVSAVTHRALDVFRWAHASVDVSTADSPGAVHELTRTAIECAVATADGRSLAVRVRLHGECQLHAEMLIGQTALQEVIETIAASIADDIWIEKVELATSPLRTHTTVDPTIASKLQRAIENIAFDESATQSLNAKLAELRTKIPAGAHSEELFAEIRANAPTRARDLALAMIERGGG